MNDSAASIVPATRPAEPITVSFTLTLDDYMETLLWMYRRPDMQILRTGRVFLGALVAVPILMLAIILIAWSSGVGWRPIADWVVIGGIFGGLTGAFTGEALTRRVLTKRRLIKQLSAVKGVDTSDGRFSQPARVTLTAEGIQSWTIALDQRRPWNTLVGLDETETHLLPRTDRARWIIIPKRDVEPATVVQLRRTIRERLGLAG